MPQALNQMIQKRSNDYPEMMPMLRARAEIVDKGIDKDKRQVEYVISTGSRGRRAWFMEELSLEKKHVVLTRLKNGAPALKDHVNSCDTVIGIVEKAWFDNEGNLRAIIKYDDDEESDKIYQKIVRGFLRSVSIGYIVHKYEDVTTDEDTDLILRAVLWEPVEVSNVPVPFDQGATKVRSNSDLEKMKNNNIKLYPCEVIHRQQHQEDGAMPPVEPNTQPQTQTPTPDPTQTPEPTQSRSVDPTQIAQQSEGEIQKRFMAITGLCDKHGVDAETRNSYLNENLTLEDVQTRILDKLAESSAAPQIRNSHSTASVSDTNEIERRKLIVEGVHHRALSKNTKISEDARMYRGMSLKRLIEFHAYENDSEIRSRGIHCFSDDQIIQRAFMGTSDLVNILMDVTNKSLLEGYELEESTHDIFTERMTLSDFKAQNLIRMSDVPGLKQKTEAGDYELGAFGDSLEKVQAEEYGRIVRLTRKAILNDDMSAIGKLPMLLGRGTKSLEADLSFYALFNGKLSDNKTIFDAAHNNYIAAAKAMDATELGKMRTLLRQQKTDVVKGEKARALNLPAKYLLVPSNLEMQADQIVSTIYPAQSASVNPFSVNGRTPLTPVVDSRVDEYTDQDYMMIGDKNKCEIVMLGTVNGEGPQVQQEEDFKSGGISFKITHDVGAAPANYKNVTRHKGV